jgi:hypothetical protein
VHQGIVFEPCIECHIRYDEEIIGKRQRILASRNLARRFNRLNADFRLEPLTRAIDQRDQGNRRAAHQCSQQHDIVEKVFRRRIEDVVLVKRV